MKKIFFVALLSIGVLNAFAQWALPQNLGGPTTLVTAGGGFRVPSGIILGKFVDLAAANASNASYYEGSLIYAGTKLYLRKSGAWVEVGSAAWGSITGTLSTQTDLQTALNLKLSIARLTDSLNGLRAKAFNDSVALATATALKLALSDTAAMQANEIRSVVLNTPNTIFSTPINFSVASHVASGSFSLNNQSAYTVFGNQTSSSTIPSFGKLSINSIGATGTPTSTTYLAGDGTWKTGAANAWQYSGSDIYYNLGNVGIHTTSPSTTLQVNDDNLGQNFSDTKGILIYNSTVATGTNSKQYPQQLAFRGSGWNTSTSTPIDAIFRMLMTPLSGVLNQNNPTFTLQSSVNGGASWSTIAEFSGNSANGQIFRVGGGSTLSNSGLATTSVSTIGLSVNGNGGSWSCSPTWGAGANTSRTILFNSSVNVISPGGTHTFNGLEIAPTYSIGFGTATVRGIYYNPSGGATTHIAYQNTSGNVLLGTSSGSVSIGATTTIPASRIQQTVSTSQASSPFPVMTSSQKSGIPSPQVGDHVYQTDGTEGVYVYKSSGWTFGY